MRIAFAAVLAAAVATTGLATATTAEAGGHGCRSGNCQPASRTVVKTNYRYNDVQQVHHVTKYRDVTQVQNVTQYRDVVRPNYVNVVHRTVDVTRVHPVTHVNVVTRVHPVTRVNTVTRVRDVTVYQHQREGLVQHVNMPGRTVYGHGTMMMHGGGHTVMGSHHQVYLGGSVRHVRCNC